MDYLEEHVEGTSVDALELLARLGTDHAEAVRDAERKLQEFMGTTDLLWDGNAAENIHKDRLRSIEAQLAQASTQRTAALSRLAVIDEFLKKNSGSQVGDVEFLALLGGQEADRLDRIRNITNGDPNSAAFQADAPIRSLAANSEYTEFLELVMKEEKLLEQFGDGHPSVVSVRSQMKTLRNFVDQKSAGLGAVEEIDRLKPQEMLSAFTKLLQHDIAEAEKRQEVLQLERMEELRLAKSLEADELKANALRSELSRQQSLSENTQAAIKGLNFVREYSGYSTDVIGDAEPRYSPVWPLPSSLFFQGLFGGLLVGLGMGVLADMADTTFTNPDDISRTLGVDILAHVPTFPTIREPKDGEPLLMDPSVYSFHKPGSPESEVFKILRSSVFCSMKDFSGRIVQITSPQPGDGKSTAAINFSVALAQSGRRTLLIDADMRRPRVADLGRVKRVPGLSEVLLGNLEPADAIKDTAQPNLSLVPSGRRPAAPAELLQSPEFRDLLQVYSEQFDFVIVDTPPILAVSDAVIVTELVDAVIMVLRVVKHGRSAAVRTCQIIEQHDAKLLGVVVNGFGVDRNQYGYLDKSDKYGYSYSTSSKSKSYYSDTEVEDSEPLEIEQPL